MFDKIEKLDGSLIQHGPNNDRVYLMKLAGKDAPGANGADPDKKSESAKVTAKAKS